jgi:serine/threonine protein kinase
VTGVKICDFGVSKIMRKGVVVNESCGTPAYLAPEIVKERGYSGFAVDVWSLGVLLYAMVCGTVPFKADTMDELHEKIQLGKFKYRGKVTSECQNLLERMIEVDPSKRISLPQILAHPWLKETRDSDSETEDSKNNENTRPSSEEKKDFDSVSGNINYVNVDNLFFNDDYRTKLSYTDYCCITEDFTTHNISEEALKVCEGFGFPKSFILRCIQEGQINHATASYFVQVLN